MILLPFSREQSTFSSRTTTGRNLGHNQCVSSIDTLLLGSLALNRKNEKAKEAYELAKAAHEENQSKRDAFEERWPCSILARARSPDSPFSKLPESIQLSLEQKAEQAADVFQRSSSCVEGRNGQLSLRHHGLRELTASKLRALRTIHNYVIQRPDGTTAAERFFANKPRDLFRWLLDQLPMPARPRQKKK